MDYETILSSVKKTNRLIVVEESWPFASVSSEVSYHIQKNAFDYLDAPISRICSADVPMAYAPNLVTEFLPKVETIVEKGKKYFIYNFKFLLIICTTFSKSSSLFHNLNYQFQ